ncbi:MAG: hydrogenase maturation protease [Tabrizicola sp.]|nr:hydrogenase maturation protease [Tabrizicola sp.]
MTRLLLIGYGNPGRGDDGLGPALAERMSGRNLPGLTVEIDYQLTVDHAALIATHDAVVFADAAMELGMPYRLTQVEGTPQALGSHQVTPEAALHLAWLLYGRSVPGWVLAIGGEAFGEVQEGLSAVALSNLHLAEQFLAGWIRQAVRAA